MPFIVTGVLEHVHTQPHKTKPGLFVLGLLVRGVYYNTCTKYPNKYQKGQTVELTVNEASGLLNYQDIKILSPSSTPSTTIVASTPNSGSNRSTKSLEPTSPTLDGVLKGITLVSSELSKIINQLNVIASQLSISHSVVPSVTTPPETLQESLTMMDEPLDDEPQY